MKTNHLTDDFLSEIIVSDPIQAAADFIKNKYGVNEVFDDSEIIDYVKDVFNPEDIFSQNQLDTWVKDNGYIK